MRSELPPELSLGGEPDADDAGVVGEPSDDPEVVVERPDAPDGLARPDAAGTHRAVLLACAVVAALALVVVAWSSWLTAGAEREVACLNRVQMRMWASNDPAGTGPPEIREALEECGLEVPDADEDGAGRRGD